VGYGLEWYSLRHYTDIYFGLGQMTSYLVGRSVATADIVTPAENPAVSRTHVRLTHVAGTRYRIDDLNSTGGTFVLQGVAWGRIVKAEVDIDDPIRLTDYETTVRRLLASKEHKTVVQEIPAPPQQAAVPQPQQPPPVPVAKAAPPIDPRRYAQPSQPNDVFLSYSRHDKDRVVSLVRLLEQQGWRVFWDIKIAPGKQWLDVIEGSITGSRAVVVVWSENSVRSEWVKAEAIRARELGLMIPIRIDQCRLPMPFGMVQTADINLGSNLNADDPAVRDLIDAVGNLIQRSVSQAVQVVGAKGSAEAAAATSTWFDWLHVFFSLKGRINRKEYWGGTLASLPLSIFLILLISDSIRTSPTGLPEPEQHALAGAISFVAMSYVNMALLRKRMHDFGRSGWWATPVIIILMIAHVGAAVIQRHPSPQEAAGVGAAFVLLFVCWLIIGLHRGDPGSNKYGPPRLKR
jgi:uncharacterized membrane protein YhaH (DUF805 family)